MPSIVTPGNEDERLRAVAATKLTAGSGEYREVARRAAEVCGTPIALVTLITADRQWILASVGTEVQEMGRDVSFCAHTILQAQPMVVMDAREDARFTRNPLVTRLGGRFYAGVPLVVSDGLALGTLCVIDFRPRTLDAGQLDELRRLARDVALDLEVRRGATERAAAGDALRAQQAMHDATVAAALDSIVTIDHLGHVQEFNPAAERTFGYAREQAIGRELGELIIPPALRDRHRVGMARLLASGESRILDRRVELQGMRRDGTEFPIELTVTQLAADPPLFTGHIRDISERRCFEATLRDHADHDPLTGLFNRRVFQERLDGMAARRPANEPVGALILIDLDDFKLVNDFLGHRAGDRAIRQVADALRGSLSEPTIAARLGADEFAILLPGCPGDEAVRVAGHLIEQIATVEESPDLGASAGVATLANGATAEDALVAADMALYEAKSTGGRRATLYAGREPQALRTVARIRAAIAAERLVLHAQPIIDLTTGQVVQHELLVRMLDEGDGLISPGEFIPVAERFGLIQEIDRWVLTQAAELARGGMKVAINLSARSLGDSRLSALLQAQIEAGLPSRNLNFELTETAALSDIEAARAFAEPLACRGFEFELDDFGTGFGALVHLKHLPISTIKIDIEFVRNASRSTADRDMIQAMVSVAQVLGKHTIAEGVEDADTLELLRRLGVDRAQGYHIGRPAPIDRAHGPGVRPRKAVGPQDR